MTNVLCILSHYSARQVAWREIKRLVDESGIALRSEFNETNHRCTLPDGSRIYLSSCSSHYDVDKLRGISWDEILVDGSLKSSLFVELREVLAPALRGQLTTMDVIADLRAVIESVLAKQSVSSRRDADSDALDLAWGLIANASGGDWTKQSAEWRAAAERWRDDYYLGSAQPPKARP